MNTTTLYGRLTADPELQTASNGNEFVRFTLAVDRRLSRKTREEQLPEGRLPSVRRLEGHGTPPLDPLQEGEPDQREGKAREQHLYE